MTTTKQKDESPKLTAGGFHAEDCPCNSCKACRRTKAEQDAQLRRAIFGATEGMPRPVTPAPEKPAQHSPLPGQGIHPPTTEELYWRACYERVKAERDAETLRRKTAENENKRLIREREAGWGSVIAERDELLAALKKGVVAMKALGWDTARTDFRLWFDKAQAAIAKAEGKQ